MRVHGMALGCLSARLSASLSIFVLPRLFADPTNLTCALFCEADCTTAFL
jgi:hypothetical protein